MTKQSVLEMLYRNKGQSISGETISRELHITRAAVWKAVQSLREDGIAIAAVTNKGYSLPADFDLLNAESIRQSCTVSVVPIVFHELDSTNTYLKQQAVSGAPEWTLAVTETQTAGRGRLGRSFYSPPGSGIYMSFLLRPQIAAKDCVFLTVAAAVAVSRAIQKLCGIELQIKWVNDLYYQGKKLCGILTEAALELESGGLQYAVVGIGINQTTEAFPEELQSIATSLRQCGADLCERNRLIAEIINQFVPLYQNLLSKEYLPEYRERSCTLGQTVTVTQGNLSYLAEAIEIDDDAQLIVKRTDGTLCALNSGEVSLHAK